MIFSDVFSAFCFAIYATPADGLFWNRHHEHIHPVQAPRFRRQVSDIPYNSTTWPANYSAIASIGYNTTTPSSNFTFSPLSMNSADSLTVQGILVTATVPVYEVCNIPGASSDASCSTIYSTLTTSSCSTTVTAGFARYMISDCEQNVTFSTQSSYSVMTAIAVTSGGAPASVLNEWDIACPSPTHSTYIQDVVTSYVCHWRSLASGDPSDVTVVICRTELDGQESCEEIQEVWVIRTELVQVTTASIVSINRFFQYPAVINFGAGESMSVDSGHVNFRTSLVYTTSTVHCATSTAQQLSAMASLSQALQTSTTTSTTTIFTTTTITITLQGALTTPNAPASAVEPTTTLTSYTTTTETVTGQL